MYESVKFLCVIFWSVRLWRSCHSSCYHWLRQDCEWWGGKDSLLALAGVSAGKTGVNNNANSKKRYHLFHHFKFFFAGLHWLPLLRWLPDQRVVGCDCCSLQCPVRQY